MDERYDSVTGRTVEETEMPMCAPGTRDNNEEEDQMGCGSSVVGAGENQGQGNPRKGEERPIREQLVTVGIQIQEAGLDRTIEG